MRDFSGKNQGAALGGLWHQGEIEKRLARWRVDAIGFALAGKLFGEEGRKGAWLIHPLEARDKTAKPDFGARLEGSAGNKEVWISAKLISSMEEEGEEQAKHHAGRVKFADAPGEGLLPGDENPRVQAWLMEHFMDGEPLGARKAGEIEETLAFFRASWGKIARGALEGSAEFKAGWLLVSKAIREGEELKLWETRCASMDEVLAWVGEEEPTVSSPRSGQVGLIGSAWMTLQRGQAQSLGAQRDIQVKINAGKLFARMRV